MHIRCFDLYLKKYLAALANEDFKERRLSLIIVTDGLFRLAKIEQRSAKLDQTSLFVLTLINFSKKFITKKSSKVLANEDL